MQGHVLRNLLQILNQMVSAENSSKGGERWMTTSPQCTHKKKARIIMRCTTKATIKDTGDCVCTFLATLFQQRLSQTGTPTAFMYILGL